MPAAAVDAILKEQAEWEKERQRKSTQETLHKRYMCQIQI